jgi:hypothetical protein
MGRRWKAQLKKGEEDAPIDPRTNKRKIYILTDEFIEEIINASEKANAK